MKHRLLCCLLIPVLLAGCSPRMAALGKGYRKDLPKCRCHSLKIIADAHSEDRIPDIPGHPYVPGTMLIRLWHR